MNMDLFCKHRMLKTKCSICNPEIKKTLSFSPSAPKVFVEDRNLVFIGFLPNHISANLCSTFFSLKPRAATKPIKRTFRAANFRTDLLV